MRVSGEGSSEPTIISASCRTVVVLGSAVPTVVPRRMTVIASATLRTSSSLCEMKMTVRPSRLSSREVAEQLVDLLRHQDGGRLVEDQDAGAAVEHLGDLDPLPGADAEVLDQHVGVEVEGVAVGDLEDPAAGLGAVQPAAPRGLAAQDDVLQDGEVVGQHEVLVDHADAGAIASAGLRKRHLAAVERDRALVGAVHAVEGLHQRRLAGAVLAHDGVHLAAADPQLDVAVGDDAGEALGDPAQLDREGRCRRRSRLGAGGAPPVPPVAAMVGLSSGASAGARRTSTRLRRWDGVDRPSPARRASHPRRIGWPMMSHPGDR